jgi:hypothetical protein
MKTFEELEECVKNINEMEEIFKNVVILSAHWEIVQRYRSLKNRVFEILMKDVHKEEVKGNES